MSLMRFEPFVDPFRSFDRLASQLVSGARTPMGMPMDVWQTDDGYHVALDLPGVDPGSVEITFERNVLTIPMAESAQPRRIEVQTSGRQHQLSVGDGEEARAQSGGGSAQQG